VLLVGNRTNENGTDGWTLVPPGAKVIHLDIDGTEIGRTYEALRLVGDARAGLEDLLEALDGDELLGKRRGARQALEMRIADARCNHIEELERLVDLDAPVIRPERLMREIDSRIDERTVLVADASYSTIWMNNYLTARKPGQQFIAPRGMAGLGWGFPMALGAKVARPSSEVICISGDGGFGHVWQELESAVRENLALTAIVLNNSILGFQKHSELVQFGETTTAIAFNEVDHAAIARSCGAEGIRVERPEDIGPALDAAIGNGKVTLIEVITDSDAFPPITAWEKRADVLPPVGE